MKKIYIFLLLVPFFTIAQVTNEGTPMSWDRNHQNIEKIILPEFDLNAVQEEDETNDAKGDAPWRFGYEHQVDFGLQTHGTWTTLDNGDRYWMMNVKSEGAKTMNFMFDEFYIPEGGKLYFYNEAKTDLLGAYTHTQNREDMVFGSWLINGDDIFIYYFEPSDKNGQGRLHINKAIHGYRSVQDFEISNKNLNSSGPCNLDVDCSIGADFDPVKDELKKAVGMVIVGGSGFCSGSLINNTNNDGTPYFLTAEHCVNSNVGFWAFRFNWRSPNPVCATTANSTNSSFNQTASGSVLRASNFVSDFALLEINANLPSSWDLVWAGWDRTTTVPNYTVSIHHPSGDIMKVCRDDDSPQSIISGGQHFWYVNEWEAGVTEGGSSGSPLLNPQGRIIGVLTGGQASCAGTSNNGLFDVYGRFNHGWSNGNSASSRLRDWLDPNNTGVTTLNPFPNNLSTEEFVTQNVKIYPNPVNDYLNIESLNSIQHIDIVDISGRIIKTSTDNTLEMSSLTKGIYFVKIYFENSNQSITKKIIKQ